MWSRSQRPFFPILSTRSLRSPPRPHAAGRFELFVTDTQHNENRTALVGCGDRVDARIESRRNQCFDTGDRQFLVFGIRQVDHFGDEVVAFDLIEIFVVEFDRNAVV